MSTGVGEGQRTKAFWLRPCLAYLASSPYLNMADERIAIEVGEEGEQPAMPERNTVRLYQEPTQLS
jgi:hypothetical protein